MIPQMFLDNVPKADEILSNDQRKSELLQIIVQTLNDFGYSKSADAVIQESGIQFENDILQELRKNVMDGNWQTVFDIVDRINMDATKKDIAKYLVNEQIYLEMIAEKNIQGALTLLRDTLSRSSTDFQRLHKLGRLITYESEKNNIPILTSLVICKSIDELNRVLGYTFSASENRKNLLSEIQDKCQLSNMINSKRISTLLHQSLCYQVLSAKYYDPNKQAYFGLLEDFVCEEEPLPSRAIQSLRQHRDEVWIVKFSYDGNYLASIGKNYDLIVWNFDNETYTASLKFRKDKIHDKEVNSMNWSQDSKKILTGSSDYKIKLWNVETGELKLSIIGHNDIVCSAIWLPDSEHFVSGGIDNYIVMWNTRGEQIFQLKSTRITDLMISQNGKMLFSVSASSFKITVIDINRRNELYQIQEKDLIISACCSSDSKYLLVNTSHKFPELHLWSLDSFKLIQRFTGHIQEKYIIRCCFGGENDKYLACGGEDAVIRLWHRNISEPVKMLSGHSLTVNCVNWHPKNQRVMASGSDDNTVKIWVSDDIAEKMKDMIESDKTSGFGDAMHEENDKTLDELPHLFEDEEDDDSLNT